MQIILKLFYFFMSNKIGVSSLKMTITPKHLEAN